MAKKLTKKQDTARQAWLIKHSWRALWAALALSILAGFIWPLYGHFAIEHVPLFYAVFGFAACVAIIFCSKLLGAVLKRPLDYYEKDDA